MDENTFFVSCALTSKEGRVSGIFSTLSIPFGYKSGSSAIIFLLGVAGLAQCSAEVLTPSNSLGPALSCWLTSFLHFAACLKLFQQSLNTMDSHKPHSG